MVAGECSSTIISTLANCAGKTVAGSVVDTLPTATTCAWAYSTGVTNLAAASTGNAVWVATLTSTSTSTAAYYCQ